MADRPAAGNDLVGARLSLWNAFLAPQHLLDDVERTTRQQPLLHGVFGVVAAEEDRLALEARPVEIVLDELVLELLAVGEGEDEQRSGTQDTRELRHCLRVPVTGDVLDHRDAVGGVEAPVRVGERRAVCGLQREPPIAVARRVSASDQPLPAFDLGRPKVGRDHARSGVLCQPGRKQLRTGEVEHACRRFCADQPAGPWELDHPVDVERHPDPPGRLGSTAPQEASTAERDAEAHELPRRGRGPRPIEDGHRGNDSPLVGSRPCPARSL